MDQNTLHAPLTSPNRVTMIRLIWCLNGDWWLEVDVESPRPKNIWMLYSLYRLFTSPVLHGTWVCSFAWEELRHGRKTESMEGFWCKCKFLGCQICFATLIDLVAGVLCLTLCCRGRKHSSCHLKKPKESYLISICGCERRTSSPNVVQSH